MSSSERNNNSNNNTKKLQPEVNSYEIKTNVNEIQLNGDCVKKEDQDNKDRGRCKSNFCKYGDTNFLSKVNQC